MRMQQHPHPHCKVFWFGLDTAWSKGLHVVGVCEQYFGIVFSGSVSDKKKIPIQVISYPFGVQDHQNASVDVSPKTSPALLLPKRSQDKKQPLFLYANSAVFGLFFN